MGMSQPADLASHSFFTCDGIVVFHDHVKIRADEPQRCAVEIEQSVNIRPLSICQVHKGRSVTREEFADVSENGRLVRDCRNLDRFSQTHNPNFPPCEQPIKTACKTSGGLGCYAAVPSGRQTARPRTFPALKSWEASATRVSG